MNSRKLLKLTPFLILTALNLVALSSHAAFAGGTSGGGGDSVAAHFADAGKRVGILFKRQCATPEPSETELCSFKGNFLQALALTKVVPSQDPVLGPDGNPREANNDGISTITVNVSAWNNLAQNSAHAERAVRLVMHEYAQLAKLESSDSYARSGALMAMFKANMIDLRAVLGKSPIPANNQACGLAGTIAERTADCNTTYPGGWSLVVRTTSLAEYWRAPNGAIWSPSLGAHPGTTDVCNMYGYYGLTDLEVANQWQFPTVDDFLHAPGLLPGKYWLRPEQPHTLEYPDYRCTLATVTAKGVTFRTDGSSCRAKETIRCVLRAK